MEGVSPIDTVNASPMMLLAADLSEYYGGSTFDEAEEVLVSQLKYSHRRPDTTWTASRLASIGSRGQAGVLRRLAETFKAHEQAHPREEMLAKLRLRLVSNQPAHPNLTAVLARTRAVLDERPARARLSTLTAALTPSQQADLRRLHAASGLSELAFSDLLRVLDIDDLGSASRARQEMQIISALGRHLIGGARGAARDLYHLFRKEALPEATGRLGVGKADLLAALDVPSEEALFPLPAKFSDPHDPIPTADAAAVASAICEGDSHVVAHGNAGVGKTTMLALLEKRLPPGSAVVRYDCFGSGQYLSPAEPRHQIELALLQIINELAVQIGAPLLVRRGDAFGSWQHLLHTLRLVSATMSESGARLVIAIDASDNAAFAGQEQAQETFIPGLWRLPLPDRVHVVMTARTHRIHLIAPPADATQILLRGFGPDGSAAHLRGRFSDATDTQCATFHVRSDGNPRTQFYVLDASRPGATASIAEALTAASRTPETIFEDLVRASTNESGDPEAGREHLADLACLTRPLRLSDFVAVTGLTIQEAERFCDGMAPGVVHDDGEVRFRDEDFETYVRMQFTDIETKAVHARLGLRLLANRLVDVYAAIACAEHLYLGGRLGELISLAIEDPQPEVVADPVAKLQVYFRRIALAMHVAEHPDWRSHAFRLAMLAAKAASTNDAVATVVRKRPDLAMRHSDARSIERIFEASRAEPWRGARHLRSAGLYAQAGENDRAAEQLDLANAWLRRRYELTSQERHDWSLEPEDVAAGLVALRALKGPAAVVETLSRWQPMAFVMETAHELVAMLATHGEPDLIHDIMSVGIPAWLRASLAQRAASGGATLDAETLRAIAEEALACPPNPRRRRERWVVDFLELLASATGDPEIVGRWAALYVPSMPTHAPSRWEGLGNWTAPVRHKVLSAAAYDRVVSADDIIPSSWTLDEDADPRERSRRKDDIDALRRALRDELPMLALRARALLGRTSNEEIGSDIDALADRLESSSRHREDHGPTSVTRALPAVEALIACGGDISPRLERISKAAGKHDGPSGVQTTIRLSMAVIVHEPYRNSALRWLDDIVHATTASQEPASERADRLLEISGIVDPYDTEAARSYYHAAIEAAEGLDNEGAGALDVHASLASQCLTLPAERRRLLAYRLADAVQHYQPYVSDDGFLPWKQTIAAVAAIDPPSGLALMTRWELEDRLAITTSVPLVARAVTERSFLDPAEAACLLLLAGEDDFSFRTAFDLIDMVLASGRKPRARAATIVDRLALMVIRDLSPNNRVALARAVHVWAESHHLSSSILAELADLAAYVDTLPERANPYGSPNLRYREDRDEKIAVVLAGAAADAPEDVPARLDALIEAWAGDEQVQSYLDSVADALAPANRRGLLEVLSSLPSGHRLWRSHGDVVLLSLSRWLPLWRTRLGVKSWIETELPQMINDRFADLVPYEQAADKSLALVYELDLKDPGGLIVRAAGPLVAQLGAGQLYAIARALGRDLDEMERADALEWTLARHEQIEPVAPAIPGEPDIVLASVLWGCFGHPERRVRWRAAHTAREILPASPTAIGPLFELARTRTPGAFVSPEREFLWMSAMQWSMLVLARLAHDRPEIVGLHIDELVSIAADKAFPHASIRELARRAALALGATSHACLDLEVAEVLRFTNLPASCSMQRREYGLGDRDDRREARRFHFNAMDTIPYWYAPFAERFGLTAQDIIVRAERWIVDEFGFSDDLVRHERDAAGVRYRWEETHNDHGSLPRVEDLRTYLEYHAMLLVGGELVDEGQPVVVGRDDFERETWAGWLSEHLDISPLRWAADRRQPAPLELATFGFVPSREDWRLRDDGEFDAILGLSGATTDALVVSSYVEIDRSDRYATSWVASALVSPETASALLRALQTCENPSNFRLPEAKEEDWIDEMEINQPGFALVGWIMDVERHELGLEEHDSLRRIGRRIIRPGRAFLAHHKASLVDEGIQIVGPTGEVLAWMDAWSDVGSEERGYDRTDTTGRRTWVGLDPLLQFLAGIGMDLIFEVRIARQFHRSSTNWEEDDESYETGSSRIYLLRRGGSLETLAGGRTLGRRDSPPPRAGDLRRHARAVDGASHRRAAGTSGAGRGRKGRSPGPDPSLLGAAP
jgi:hypothetical protein